MKNKSSREYFEMLKEKLVENASRSLLYERHKRVDEGDQRPRRTVNAKSNGKISKIHEIVPKDRLRALGSSRKWCPLTTRKLDNF